MRYEFEQILAFFEKFFLVGSFQAKPAVVGPNPTIGFIRSEPAVKP